MLKNVHHPRKEIKKTSDLRKEIARWAKA